MTITAVPGRDYRLFWSAAVCSQVGDSLRTPALALLAATLTRDPRAVAAVTVAGLLPPLLFGLLSGVYADRWDRRRTMAVVDGGRAVVVAALAWSVATGHAGIATLVVVASLLALLGTLFDASAYALLPTVVPPEGLAGANARLQAGTAVAGGFVGAPLAGVLFAVSPALPFTADALTFALAAVLILAIPAPTPRRSCTFRPGKATQKGQSRGRNRKINEDKGGVWEGIRFLRRDRVLWALTVGTAGSNLAIGGLAPVLVLYALAVLRVPDAAYGLFAAGAVAGGLGGALFAGRLAARFGTLPTLRVVLLGQTLALAGFALARHPLTGGLAMAGFTAGSTIWNSLRAAYGQRHVPPDLLGRVGAAQRVAGLAAAPAGAVLAGLAAQAFGLTPVPWAAAAVFALVTAAVWVTFRARTGPPAAPSH
ncbi:MFS transporter [Micromonospora aurantiaca (nom. illeg.)]|uniref:MFS transporter n=1 Tax=Micromonospora aurantiaca (nom. illeg.) TaxID=47850 RepID=UPI0036484E27